MHVRLLMAQPFAFGLVGLLASLAAFGCSEAEPASGASGVGRSEQSIVYGKVSGPEDDAVVQTVAKDGGVIYRCTGTLIAPNLVITARHCVSHFVELNFTCTPEGELTPDSQGGAMGALYDPAVVSVRIGGGPNPPFGANAKQLFAVQTPSICRNDVALILLDRELTNLPIKPIRLFTGTERNEVLKVIGYGVDETDFFGIRHVRDGLVVKQVGPNEFRTESDPIPPRTFLTEGGALCIGDSGGPAFVDSGAIAGVWSQVVGDCKTPAARNYFTQIAPFADSLVLPAFEAAGAEPWLEGNSGPGLNSGGSVGTGGAVGSGGGGNAGGTGNAGDTSTGGDGMTETGGSAGMGSVATGGLVGDGGEPSSAGAPSGGVDGSGGTESSGGRANSGAGGEGGGLRKKGGCTCDVAGAPSGGSELLLAPLAALALLRRRRVARV